MARHDFFRKLTFFHLFSSVLCFYLLMTSFAFAIENEQSIIDPEKLHIGLTLEPTSLDPTTDASAVIQRITYQNIFEGLTQINQKGQVLPSLAKSWVVSDDGLTYTFLLHENVYFHNGVLLTADIVRSSLLRLTSKDSKNSIKHKFTHINTIVVNNDNEVEVQLQWPDIHFLFNLGLGCAVIQEPKSYSSNSQKPTGTGPYIFQEWEKGNFLKLRANPNYWQTLPSIKQVLITFVPTRSEVVELLAQSTIDGYDNMSEINFLQTLSTQSRYQQVFGQTQGEIIIAFNHANKMLASLPIRKAISYAIDKNKIKSNLYFGESELISSFFPASHEASLHLSEGYSFNLDKAKSLMGGNKVAIKPLRLIIPPTTYARYIGVYIPQMLEQINIPVTVESLTWEEWTKRVYIDKDYDLSVVAHTEANDLEIFAKDNYYFNYSNVEYKQLMKKLMQTTQQLQRNPLLKKAQRLLIEDAASVFLMMLPKTGIWDSRLQGYWIDEPLPALIFSQISWRSKTMNVVVQ